MCTDHEFNYDDASPIGPKKWGSLSAGFKACSDGESQSPVDIEAKKAKDQHNDLKRSYKEAPAKLFNKGHHIAVCSLVPNKLMHATMISVLTFVLVIVLTVEWDGDAGGIEVNGTTYKLVQCHWHIPGEHTFDGKRYDAEIHFVHSNDKYQLAVVGVLYAIGEPDPFIGKLSESKFKEISANGNDLGKVSASSITSSKKYFRYGGSLTTPPCSEGVTWTVAETVKSISKEQIESLEGPLEAEFKENARPVQQLSGRTVTQFEDKE
ncbi:alpha carbonic anhydrase 4-like [Bidens hawaiensis]|uniref:alpha carbonic anhydrase 4-like n=1 Tax=Bidens hawaiensis TaxID=980011 RepID=UPI00404A1CC7